MTGRYLCVAPEVIREIQLEPSTLLEILYPASEFRDHEARSLDIGKTWRIIHFLLNDDAWEGTGPLLDAVLGGTQLTEEDLGYGPARFLSSSEVAATARALDAVSPDELWSRFDESHARDAEIYWEPASECRRYALDNYEELRQFFSSGAAKGRQ